MSQIKTARTSGVAPHTPVIEPLSISENGTYTAPTGVDGYSPVTVDVPNTYTASDEGKVVSSGALVAQTTRTVTENGTYDTTTNNSVVVDVQEQPWQPLEDGYSNFWFELTDDTLSPWLNFSAKNADAVIDWGDGTGETTLDTLTPTHTYSKAGKYVVKVKGVTGIATQINTASNAAYVDVLHHVELNNEITSIANYSFQYTAIEELSIPSSVNTIGSAILRACGLLKKVESASNASFVGMCAYCTFLSDVEITGTPTTIGNNSFYQCVALKEITLPSSIEDIGVSVFNSCIFLNTIHIQATTPPTLGSNVFAGIASDYIIYVPVGTGDTYKAAAGWSAYADHIVEEGQTLSKAALRRIQAVEKNSEGDDVR